MESSSCRASPVFARNGQFDSVLRFHDFNTQRVEDKAVISGPLGWGLAIYPDRRCALVTRVGSGESDLRLISDLK
jgi:hypothetical protein